MLVYIFTRLWEQDLRIVVRNEGKTRGWTSRVSTATIRPRVDFKVYDPSPNREQTRGRPDTG